MGAAEACEVRDADREPLLSSSSTNSSQYVAVATEDARNEADGPFVEERSWQGSLLHCCGDCDQIGVGSCLMGRNLPCVAFGWNVKRGLRQSAWAHGLLFLLLFVLAAWVSIAAVFATEHNMLATCNGPLPGPRNPQAVVGFSAQGRDLWSTLGSDDITALVTGPDGREHLQHAHLDHKHSDENEESDGNDGDHHKPSKGKQDDGKHKPGKDKKKCKGKHGKKGEKQGEPGTAIFAQQSSGSFRSVGNFVGHTQGPKRNHPHQPQPSPECKQAVMWFAVAWLLSIASSLGAVWYAATRRTLLRKQFGIAGSKLGDFCTWCWCGPCALCQETRTLWANNVREGVWHGPTHLQQGAVAATSPPTQFMTSGSQA